MIVYGVDLDKQVSPSIVRDALLDCFYVAHCEDIGLISADESDSREYCQGIVQKMFKDTNGDFANPTKESLLKVVSQLVEFSKNFRDPEVVKKHAAEIMMLVGKLN